MQATHRREREVAEEPGHDGVRPAGPERCHVRADPAATRDGSGPPWTTAQGHTRETTNTDEQTVRRRSADAAKSATVTMGLGGSICPLLTT